MPKSSYRLLRMKASPYMPTTKVGKLALYFVLLRAVVAILQLVALAGNWPGLMSAVSGWGTAFNWILIPLLTILFWRWARDRFMWRLRNRLIVTYVFIGVIPVLLLTMLVGIAGYLFLNQYATSQAGQELEAEARSLEVVSSSIAADIAQRAGKSQALEALHDLRFVESRFPGLEVAVWRGGKPLYLHKDLKADTAPADMKLPEWITGDFRGRVTEDGRLFLRAVSSTGEGDARVRVLVSAPISKEVMARAAQGLGELRIYASTSVRVRGENKGGGIRFSRPQRPTGVRVETPATSGETAAQKSDENPNVDYQINQSPTLSAGSVTEDDRWYNARATYGTLTPLRDWATGQEAITSLVVSTRPMVLIGRLFSNMGEFAGAVLTAMGAIAITFAVIELIAIFFGIGLTRTITNSVYNLYKATQHINRGDLTHRIKVKNKDQLADLQNSFNSMSQNLERLIEEQKEKERLESELAIAQEVQATLFPRETAEIQSLELHGICRPARSVSGDYYDFIPCGSEQLALALGDISGKGISAALLMATVHSAVRVYEFGKAPSRKELVRAGTAAIASALNTGDGPEYAMSGGLHSPAIVMELLNRHLYYSTTPEKYATLFLGVYDGHRRTLTYCNAGHLPPIIISEDGTVRRLETGGMVVGLFDRMTYEESVIELRPRDIFVAFSDGITEPENEFGEFGETRLIELIRENRHLPLARLSETVTAAVQDWIGSAEQPDDVTLVLARTR